MIVGRPKEHTTVKLSGNRKYLLLVDKKCKWTFISGACFLKVKFENPLILSVTIASIKRATVFETSPKVLQTSSFKSSSQWFHFCDCERFVANYVSIRIYIFNSSSVFVKLFE